MTSNNKTIHTRVIHPNDTHTRYRPDQSIRGISTLLQQLNPNMTTNLALRRHGTQMRRLQLRHSRRIRLPRNRIPQRRLQRQKTGDIMIQTSRRHDSNNHIRSSNEQVAKGRNKKRQGWIHDLIIKPPLSPAARSSPVGTDPPPATLVLLTLRGACADFVSINRDVDLVIPGLARQKFIHACGSWLGSYGHQNAYMRGCAVGAQKSRNRNGRGARQRSVRFRHCGLWKFPFGRFLYAVFLYAGLSACVV